MGWMRAVVRRGVSVVVVSGPLREEGVAEPVTHSTRESKVGAGTQENIAQSPEATDTTTVTGDLPQSDVDMLPLSALNCFN